MSQKAVFATKMDNQFLRWHIRRRWLLQAITMMSLCAVIYTFLSASYEEPETLTLENDQLGVYSPKNKPDNVLEEHDTLPLLQAPGGVEEKTLLEIPTGKRESLLSRSPGNGLEGDVTSYFPVLEQARAKHESLFLPVVLENGYTGVETVCNPMNDRKDRSDRIIHVAIGVLSGSMPKYRDRRQKWREAWSKWPAKMRVLAVMRFFVALPETSEQLRALQDEADEHKDMIILGHRDHYTNITMKSIGVFTWGAEMCGSYYTVKTDDDTFIHLPRLLMKLYTLTPTAIYAGTKLNSVPWHPLRNPQSQWYTPLKEFPFKEGPGYIRGAMIVMSWDLASVVARVRHSPNFHWLAHEDVTLGYILAPLKPNLLDIPLTFSPRQCKESAVAVHYVPADKLSVLMENVLNKRPLCQGYP